MKLKLWIKRFIMVCLFLVAFFGVGFAGMLIANAEEPKIEEPITPGVSNQHNEDDVLLKFYDGSGEIIKINWNGTVEYQGELDYVSEKFWELLLKKVPQFCPRNTILFNLKADPDLNLVITTMKGDIKLKKNGNTISAIHLNTLDDHATKFWKSIENAFPKVCK